MCVVWCENLDIQITSENPTFLNILHNYGKVFEVSLRKNIFFNRYLNKSTTCGLIITLALAAQVHAF